jgi:hypothetical protein
MNRIPLLTLAGLLALTGTGHAADELFPDKILVKGDGFEIKQSQLDQAYMQVTDGRRRPEHPGIGPPDGRAADP